MKKNSNKNKKFVRVVKLPDSHYYDFKYKESTIFKIITYPFCQIILGIVTLMLYPLYLYWVIEKHLEEKEVYYEEVY